MSRDTYLNFIDKINNIKNTVIPSIMEKLLEEDPKTKEERILIDLAYIQLHNAALFLKDCNKNLTILAKKDE